MRRVLMILTAVFAAASISAFAAFSVNAQATDQYDRDGGDPQQDSGIEPPPVSTGEAEIPPLPKGVDPDVVSQGSVGGEAPSPESASRAAADLAEEERLPDYSQVVDNSAKDRFSAVGSKTSSDPTAHGGTYASTSGKPASFRVKVPTDGDYSVYAWWPDVPGGDGAAARYSVPVASGGVTTERVDQGSDGGLWIKLGTFKMSAGERTIKLAGGGAAADAVAVVRGEIAAPPEDSYATGPEASGTQRTAAARGASSRRSVIRSARKWIGTPYKYGTCTKSRMSCTCLTKRAWGPNGHSLPMTENGQWRYEPSRKVRKSNLNPGDIVFFKEGGSKSITHVGIYSGRDNIIHASSYYRYDKVVESKMKYVKGYFGASRLKPR